MDVSLLTVSLALVIWSLWELRTSDWRLLLDPRIQAAYWTEARTAVPVVVGESRRQDRMQDAS